MKRAGVPVEHRVARSKPEIALAKIDRVIPAGVRFGWLADAGYGVSAPFRQGLTTRGLAWAVGILRHLKVYPAGVKLIWPSVAGRGRPPQAAHSGHPVEGGRRHAGQFQVAECELAKRHQGSAGSSLRRVVRTADGPPQRIKDMGQQHLPGDEAWLIGEHRMSGEKKYYLANLPRLKRICAC